MKIAYLITVYNNYKHLGRLIRALDEGNPHFYLHVDQKSKLPSNLEGIDNVSFIKRHKVWWGGWSHQKAIISLMHSAAISGYDYYVLISGSDYPIRPNSFLYDKLNEGGEYLNLLEGFQPHKPENRIKYYHFDNFDRRDLKSRKTRLMLKFENRLRSYFRKNHYPFKKIYHGSTWWALSHKTIGHILDYIDDNPAFVKFFQTSWCPEEAFIPTIIGNSPIRSLCKTSLTYTDWSVDPGPAEMTEKHIALFRDQIKFEGVYGEYSPFFARKFSDDSGKLIEEIENRLR